MKGHRHSAREWRCQRRVAVKNVAQINGSSQLADTRPHRATCAIQFSSRLTIATGEACFLQNQVSRPSECHGIVGDRHRSRIVGEPEQFMIVENQARPHALQHCVKVIHIPRFDKGGGLQKANGRGTAIGVIRRQHQFNNRTARFLTAIQIEGAADGHQFEGVAVVVKIEPQATAPMKVKLLHARNGDSVRSLLSPTNDELIAIMNGISARSHRQRTQSQSSHSKINAAHRWSSHRHGVIAAARGDATGIIITAQLIKCDMRRSIGIAIVNNISRCPQRPGIDDGDIPRIARDVNAMR